MTIVASFSGVQAISDLGMTRGEESLPELPCGLFTLKAAPEEQGLESSFGLITSLDMRDLILSWVRLG